MLHEPVIEIGTDKAAAKKAKFGIIMFICYTLIYAVFVFIGLAMPELFGKHVLGKQNLAIVFGFGLIILAVVMGFIYNFFCTRMEDKMNKN